jgi:hypothetical protein
MRWLLVAWALSVHGACKQGSWRTDDGRCLLCSPGFACPEGVTMRPCDLAIERSVMEGGTRCCARNQTCPMAHMAVNGDCLCEPVACEEGRGLSQRRDGVECTRARSCARGCPATEGGRGFVLDAECQCSRWKACGEDKQMWKRNSVLFECMSSMQ